jgi:hypothetical protein
MAKLRFFLTLPLFLYSLTCSGAGMNLFSNKYDYYASESAPKGYVMRIIAGSLSGEDGSVSVPSLSNIQNGWGTGKSASAVGDDRKPLPRTLSIAFFSFVENQFYRGHFDLPYDKILKLFKEGHYSPKDNKHITYDSIVVGVAPGGAVAVWLESLDKTTEVFFGQAEKATVDWSVMTDNPMPREEFIEKILLNHLKTPEAVAALKKNGVPIGLWSRYRTHYAWQPVFTDIRLRDGRASYIRYYNGERDYWDYPLDKTQAAATRPIPMEMVFVWENTAEKGRMLEVYFDEAEIFSAFAKLASQNRPMLLEIHPNPPGAKDIISVLLRNDKDEIPLNKTIIKNYGAGPNKKQ